MIRLALACYVDDKLQIVNNNALFNGARNIFCLRDLQI